MKLKNTLFALLCIVLFARQPAIVFPEELYSILMEIDPAYASQIVDLLIKTDTSEAMLMARTIGESDDPRITDLLTILCERNDTREKSKVELLVRLLLDSVFPGTLEPRIVKARITANRVGIDLLVKKCESFDDRFLRAKVVRIAVLSDDPAFAALVQREGFGIVALLRKNNGTSTPGCDEEIVEILNGMERDMKADYFDLCVSIMNATKNSLIYEKAKELVKNYAKTD